MQKTLSNITINFRQKLKILNRPYYIDINDYSTFQYYLIQQTLAMVIHNVKDYCLSLYYKLTKEDISICKRLITKKLKQYNYIFFDEDEKVMARKITQDKYTSFDENIDEKNILDSTLLQKSNCRYLTILI